MKNKTKWFPRSIEPVRNGNYECAIRIMGGFHAIDYLAWDGKGFIVTLPSRVIRWRGATKKAHLENLAKKSKMTKVDRSPRRVVCAAIRAEDGSVLIGIRHYSMDMHRQIQARTDGAKFKHRHDPDQGFVDQRGVYMDRAEAYLVAEAADQLFDIASCGFTNGIPQLFSEGLY